MVTIEGWPLLRGFTSLKTTCIVLTWPLYRGSHYCGVSLYMYLTLGHYLSQSVRGLGLVRFVASQGFGASQVCG